MRQIEESRAVSMTSERSAGDPKFAVCPLPLARDSETGVAFLNAKWSIAFTKA